MSFHIRDKLAALIGVSLLTGLVAVSYYYAVKTELIAFKTAASRESPEFITHHICITNFSPDGVATQRIFADYAEHYTDGRSVTIKPRFVTLNPSKAQIKASANTGTSMDDGESAVFTGNVVLTRAADASHPPVRITTTHATVYPDTSVVKTDAPVVIERGTSRMKGVGMHFDNVDHTLRLDSHVEMFTVPNKKLKRK